MPDDPSASPKPKKRVRGRTVSVSSSSSAEPITTAEKAEQFAEALRIKLVEMIDLAALMRANRRRATGIDRVDYEAAFDDIVNPVPRPRRLALIGDVCGIFGAGFVGYSINIYTGPGSGHQVGHVAILAGLVLSLAGASLKYIDPTR